MIRATCPACGREAEFADFLSGLTVVCKQCSHRITVPGSGSKAAPATVDAIQAVAAPKTAAAAEDALRLALPPSNPDAPDALEAAPRAKLPARKPDDLQPLPELPSLVRPGADSTPTPPAAIERARAMLRIGLDVPQIEHRLVEQGLPPEIAAAVVEQVLADQTRELLEPLARAERHRRKHRVLSALVAGTFVLLTYAFVGAKGACWAGIAVLLPLACIWFPDELGSYTGLLSYITQRSPGVAVRWLGWLVLVLLVLRFVWLVWLGFSVAGYRR